MASDSFLDQMKAFGSKLGLPRVDVDKLVEMNRKNFEAFVKSASVAGEGAKALAEKQREIIQAAFKETAARVKDFHPAGSPQEVLAKQAEYARKAFEVAMQNTRDLAELTTKTTAEATKIVRDRIQENLGELQESVSSALAVKTVEKDDASQVADKPAAATEPPSSKRKKS
jgi:phasin family protein